MPMRDPFAGYDRWLVAPMESMMEEADRFFEFCEDHDLDPDDPDSQVIYSDYLESQYDFEPDYDYERDEDEY